ncbi:ATP-dependent DNA helicase RecG [Brachybacterium sp. J153]|uniref:ATP-dependent DNA helicase RecG n=1 Tax=Brachybacterium sp. J153 TaxID=3116488 RepID=UPI002E774509|nr:ATP-dependent DNA helicase RecG [Brachybacterium sp. J153]MEE1617168.1 ATP-dependent DNA helicase RecG [Brachybacterium sp. J153]
MARTPRTTSGSMPLSELLISKESRAMASFAVRDLDEMLRFPPRRYVTPAPLRSLREVQDGEEVSAIVTVGSIRDRSMRSRRGHLLEVEVSDGSDTLELVFFLSHAGQAEWHRARMGEGGTILVRGTAHRDPRRDRFQIAHPEYEPVDDTPAARAQALRPRPVYPLKKNIAQATMRSATATGLENAQLLRRPVPPEVLDARGLPALEDAVRLLHDPADLDEARRGRDVLAFEEAFVLQAIFAERRARDERTPAPALRADGPLQGEFDARLPFALTAGQITVGEEIAERIAREHPTSVLLQGDVGSGKTVVALRAMLRAVDSGHQAVLLAPTEVLAEQHHRTITALLGDLAGAGRLDGHADATRVRLLTGSQRTADRRETLLDVTSGAAGIVIGTHALLTETVEFAALGLVVIDEQHRFGVDHRRRLRAKGPEGRSPHVVVMTATPIPRTAALATVGDLDVLSLRESPGHRRGVTSFAVHESFPAWERRMWERAGEEIREGRQVFVVCPRIDEDEEVPEGEEPARGVLATAERLARRPELGGARIGVLHGRMSAEEKQETMARVLDGRLDVLVATTVIEVGVDVPNASVMIVLDAELFGVSQLHQLRGRVGRGEHPGLAFLDTRAVPGSEASRRLETIAGATDGFELAEKDLAHRGAGDLVGEEQSGLQRTLRHLDLRRDAELVEQAREDAFALLEQDPELTDHPALAAAIADRLRHADPDVERS